MIVTMRLPVSTLIMPLPGAGCSVGKVRGTDDERVLVEHPVDLLTAEGMIAERDRVHAAVKKIVRRHGRHTVAVGGILAVADDEVNALEALERGQPLPQKAAPDAAHHVADT